MTSILASDKDTNQVDVGHKAEVILYICISNPGRKKNAHSLEFVGRFLPLKPSCDLTKIESRVSRLVFVPTQHRG